MPQNYKFPDDIDRTQLRTEQQLDPMLNRSMQYPNPLDPIGNIETEGRALRNLSSGHMPRWVLMLSWATIGFSSFLFCGLLLKNILPEAISAIQTQQYDRLWLSTIAVLPSLLFAGLILLILFRATWRSR
ncbi:MAG: hypothetical protein HC805_02150 [Alkalinema sp. RL_2_19]|nr:hypothetical protein [Alkalinema sp. RL_2_19]